MRLAIKKNKLNSIGENRFPLAFGPKISYKVIVKISEISQAYCIFDTSRVKPEGLKD